MVVNISVFLVKGGGQKYQILPSVGICQDEDELNFFLDGW